MKPNHLPPNMQRDFTNAPNPSVSDDELIDIVDENDTVIDQQYRSIAMKKNLKFIRSIGGFLKNSKGQLWIPRRTKQKRVLPDALDLSVSGLVSAGETYEQAFARELHEELRLTIDTITYRTLGMFKPSDGDGRYFICLYEITQETTPHYNPDDFYQAEWLYPEEIMSRLAAHDKAKPCLSYLINRFYR